MCLSKSHFWGRWIWLKHRQKTLKELEKHNKTKQQIMFQWWKVLASLYEDLSLGPCSHISDSQLPLTPAWRKLTLSFEFQRYPTHVGTFTMRHTDTHAHIYTNEKSFKSKNSILSNILLALFQGPLYNSRILAFQYNFWIFKQLFQVLYIINKLLYNHKSNLKS